MPDHETQVQTVPPILSVKDLYPNSRAANADVELVFSSAK